MARKKKADGELDGRQVLESLNGKGGTKANAAGAKGSAAKAGKNAKASKTTGSKKAKGGKRNSSTTSSDNGKSKASSRLAHGAAALAAKPASAAAGLVVRTLTCLCLAFSLFGAGLLVCSTKEATQAVGQTFSNWSDSTLPADDMAAIAEEVRLFSMGQASADDLRDTTIEHVKKSYPEVAQVLETGSLATGMAEEAAKAAGVTDGNSSSSSDGVSTDVAADSNGSEASNGSVANTSKPASSITGLTGDSSNSSNPAAQLADALGLPAGFSTSGSITTAKIDSWFSLPENAVSHLADCIPVFVTAQGATVFAAIAALAGLVWLGICRGRKAFGQTMILGACIPLTLFLAISLWALIDFDGLFAAMHGLFFSAGTWTFPSDSLLIRLFPEAFWAAMAGLWAAVSIGLSLVCLAIGRLVRKGAK